jgi:hypothetical protein
MKIKYNTDPIFLFKQVTQDDVLGIQESIKVKLDHKNKLWYFVKKQILMIISILLFSSFIVDNILYIYSAIGLYTIAPIVVTGIGAYKLMSVAIKDFNKLIYIGLFFIFLSMGTMIFSGVDSGLIIQIVIFSIGCFSFFMPLFFLLIDVVNYRNIDVYIMLDHKEYKRYLEVYE